MTETQQTTLTPGILSNLTPEQESLITSKLKKEYKLYKKIYIYSYITFMIGLLLGMNINGN
jgi:hypothetical protein